MSGAETSSGRETETLRGISLQLGGYRLEISV